MDSRPGTADRLPYLSPAFLDTLMISTAEVVGEIERQIVGQRQGTV
jgi:ornithine cyclodeaminase/alanine dehydrogenase